MNNNKVVFKKRSRFENDARAELATRMIAAHTNDEYETHKSYEDISTLFARHTYVDQTALTPAMARVLQRLGTSRRREHRLLVLGAYQGLYAVWLSAEWSRQTSIVLVDTDSKALKRAEHNLRNVGYVGDLTVIASDWKQWGGFDEWCRQGGMLFVDFDDPRDGKTGYAGVLKRAYDACPQSDLLVLFHDVCMPSFTSAAMAVRDCAAQYGVEYIAVPIDECGLGVALLGQASRL